jgi:tRNA G18 (ribose-2'-O)-methylase SpoU
MSDIARPRFQVAGVRAIDALLDEGRPVRVLLVRAEDDSAATAALVTRATALGANIWRGSPGDLRRMGRGPDAHSAVAMLGPSPKADLAELLSRGGISWLLHDSSFPSNVGFAVRTAEVSGADGVIVDAQFNHEQRARVDHVSMGASRLLPVLYERSEAVLELAAASGVRCVDSPLLARCAAVVRIPMAGFVPSYNVQAAMAAIAVERLRQLDRGP